MLVSLTIRGESYTADLSQPIDISIPIEAGLGKVNCFYAPPVEFLPVVAGSFVGSTAQGGPVNFFNIKINPHGNGTHTECVGHIAREFFSINRSLKNFHFTAKLLTVFPTKTEDGDRVIFKNQLEEIFEKGEAEALVLRTMPNDGHKLHTNYSGANPPYLHHAAVEYLADCGVEHLLLDLPSVDREEDGGKLLAHKAFWKYPDTMAAGRQNCTITELIFVDSVIKDGLYLLNLQIASFELDASPSKPVLFRLERG